MDIEQIKAAWRAALEKARTIAKTAEDAGRDLTDDERTEIGGLLKEAEGHKKALKAKQDDAAVRKTIADLGAELGLEPTPQRPTGTADGFAKPGKSIGHTVIGSAEYKELLAQFPDGRIPDKARVQSRSIGFKTLLTGASDTSAGAFVETDYTGIYEPLGRRELTLRDLISVRQTGSDTVEFVRQTARTNAAAPTAEATTAALPTQDGSTGPLVEAAGGGYKPEGGFTFAKVTATVKTIAEWVPATKRGIADAAQLRGLIDEELRDGLREVEEDQVLLGDGTGENLTGILETSGIQSQAYSATVTGLDPLLETTLKAKTKVRTVGRTRPNAFLLNPADWEAIQLARLAKNPANEATGDGVPTLHGLPVVESDAITAGVGLVANFRKAVLWDREQAMVSMTDSHADFFIRNLVAVLAEERVAFGVIRPAAFVQVDLTA